MAKLTATITARQLAGFQAEADKFNAEKTAEYARRNPPEVWTPLTAEERFSERMASVGDRHANETDQVDIDEIVKGYKEGNQAKRQAIKDAAK